MDIHQIKNKIVRGVDVKLVFFDKNFEQNYDSTYVKMIQESKTIEEDLYIDRWFFKDNADNEYELKGGCIENYGGVATIKDTCKNIMWKKITNLFIENNGLPKGTKITNNIIHKHVRHVHVYKQNINRPIKIWDISGLLEFVYSAIIIVNDEIIGIVKSEIIPPDEIKDLQNDNYIMYPNMNLYISRVDIRPDYHGKGLCKPLLTYIIGQLKRLGFEQLFIENGSQMEIPACVCYFKSGVDNKYNMRYRDSKKKSFKKMSIDTCFKTPLPKTYYYMSNNIVKRATNKIKKAMKTRKSKK